MKLKLPRPTRCLIKKGSLSKVQSGFLSEFQKEIIQGSDSAGFVDEKMPDVNGGLIPVRL